MNELRRKMMLTLFGLMSLFMLAMVGALNVHEWEKTRQDLESSMVSLSQAYRMRFPWQSSGIDDPSDERVSLIYDNPAWLVSFDYGDEISAIIATQSSNVSESIPEYAMDFVESHVPGTLFSGNLLTDNLVCSYPSPQLLIIVDAGSIRSGLWMELLVSLLIGGLFEVILYFVCRKLTAWMIAPIEQTLEQQKQFIADASHELKTPVAVIQANAEAMERDPSPRWLHNITEETGRMNRLIADLLDLARSDSVPVVPEACDWSAIVEKQVMIQEARIFEAGLELRDTIETDVYVSGEPGRLEQICAILLDNAISHSSEVIAVRLRRENRQAVLEVGNTGMPIPPDVRDHIFERFYRADSARTRSSGHYGLGLAIARSMTERHGGTIAVRCEAGWTWFSVTLPAISKPEA